MTDSNNNTNTAHLTSEVLPDCLLVLSWHSHSGQYMRYIMYSTELFSTVQMYSSDKVSELRLFWKTPGDRENKEF